MSVKCSSLGPRPQFIDANGAPYAGALLFAYAVGSSTKQNTYTDGAGGTPNANPMTLDSAGRTPYELWFTEGLTYKLVLAPSTDSDPPVSPLLSLDRLAGINDVSATVDEWQASGLTPTYASATTFTVSGDQTGTFTQGRRIKSTNTGGTIYSTVSSSSYSGGTLLTTVTVVNDSSTLDSGLSAISLSILRADNPSLPAVRYYHADGTSALPSMTFVNDKDCGFWRKGANNIGGGVNGTEVIDISATGLSITGVVKTSGYTFATLPTPTAGMRAYITDSSVTTFLNNAAGGGASIVPVFYNGTNWVVG